MRSIAVASVVALLLCVSLGSADLLKSEPVLTEQNIMSMSSRAYTGPYQAGEAADAKLFGDGHTSLLLYVFDAKGNCVAWDDNITQAKFCDELATEWIADGGGRYSVEIRNAGFELHKFTLAIR